MIILEIMNKLFIFLCLLLICCKNNSSNNVTQQDALSEKDTIIYNCVIPNGILDYISSHSSEFEFLDMEQDLRAIEEYIDSNKCPITCFGDFNLNGKEDFAIILKYKGYKSPDYPNHVFPFLVVFSDYKEHQIPSIVYKTTEYQKDPIRTVIYEQHEGKGEMLTYLRKGVACGKEVVDIIYPEKSTFFVFWNDRNSQYEFLNYLDEDICEKVNSKNTSSVDNAESQANSFKEKAKNKFHSLLPEILRLNHAKGVDIIEEYIGDLTQDNIDDLVIYYSLIPSDDEDAMFSRGVVIYENSSGAPILIKQIEPDYLFHVIGVKNNILELEKLEYDEYDGRCCPSIKSKIEIKIK